MSALDSHMKSGLTTVCRCWVISRSDGVALGFTDHDEPLAFEGYAFRADAGLSAKILTQGTGLSVDNTETLGVLSDASISEREIEQGRFDGAEVQCWLVNWANVTERKVLFRGTLGEIRRGGGAFHAELRGLTDALNQPRGRVFQPRCSAVLGDGECRVDLSAPEFSAETGAVEIEDRRVFVFDGLGQFSDRFLERGRLIVLSGDGQGLWGVVKSDRMQAGRRVVELWEPLRADVGPGDLLRLEAGCDKRAETCREVFSNFLNFRGFPHIPGEDWLVSVPRGDGADDGGNLVS